MWLLALFFVGHFLGDFTPLSTPRMQEAKSTGGPFRYIAAHAAVHAGLVAVAVAMVAGLSVPLLATAGALEFVTHTAIDAGRARIVAAVPRLGDPQARGFWGLLGLDQMAHGLVLIAIAAVVL